MILNISLLAPPWLTYSWLPIPGFPAEFWQRGLRVIVPLGKRSLRAGIITCVNAPQDNRSNITLKNLLWPLERTPFLSDDILRMIEELSKRQGLETGYILGHIFPTGLRTTDVKFSWHDKIFNAQQLADLEGRNKEEAIGDFIAGKIKPTKIIKPENFEICLLCEPPWQIHPAASRQKEILDILWQYGSQSLQDLEKISGKKVKAYVKKLLSSGLVEEREREKSGNLLEKGSQNFILNNWQNKVVDNLCTALLSDEPETCLLFGITGSGKTAVYLEIAKKCLELGRSIFILAPEVALAQKLHKDFQNVFTDQKVFFYHGYQSAAKRENIWVEISGLNTAVIVVGTRSAIFLPLGEPLCIILDEEHDASYKQDEIFAYHAKELAWYRIKKSRGLLVLGSATPDIRTYNASERGIVKRTELLQRASGNNLPPIEIVNIGSGLIMGTDNSLLGKQSRSELQNCASRGEQAVILLNRRGYAPMIFCMECGKTLRCPACAIGLSYHKDIGKLICHYCGYSMDYPAPCPDCGKMRFLSIGEGTERLTEKLEAITGKEILRLDRDNTRTPGKIDEILQAFANNASPFLTGTQMLSKGLHFPNVTLVVVADGDIGLNMPDYRAGERTFQLLVQAAGRAGRGKKPGKVLIQTRNPDHYCWEYIRNYDYRGFYEEEIKRRKRLNYPPFIKLGLLRFSCMLENNAAPALITTAGRLLREEAGELNLKLLGPTVSPIAFIRGRRRFQCLIKGENWAAMRQIYFRALKLLSQDEDIRVFLDLDPVNMM